MANNKRGGQMRFTDDELALIKATFKGNEPLLKLMRKVFLPEIDPTAPLGQMIDLWLTVDVRSMDPQQALVRLMARNELIVHVDQQLMQLNALADMDENTQENPADSTE